MLLSNFLKFFKKNLLDFIKEYTWLYTFFSLTLKTMIFFSFIYSQNYKTVDLVTIKRLLGFYFPAYLCFIIVIMSFSFLLKSRAKMVFNVVVNFAVSILILIDLWNYRAFEGFPTMHSLDQLVNIDNLGSSISSMIYLIDIIFVLDILLFIPIYFVTKRKIDWHKNLKRNFLVFALLFVFSTGIVYLYHNQVDVKRNFKGKFFFTVCWTPRQTMTNLSPIGYHVFDVYVYWKDCQPIKLKEQEKEEISAWFENKKEELPDNKYKGMFKGKNVIFIETESLENCVINQKINNQEITPVINKLLQNSIYFPEFYEQTFSGTSSDAMLISNTSLYPIRRGVTFFRYPNNNYISLPKLLKGIGYDTLAAEPDRGSYWNWMNNFYNFGYDRCMDVSNFELDEKIGMGLSDGSFLRQLAPEADKLKQPFFMFMVTQTTHTPYNLPNAYRELSIPASVNNTKMGGYLQSLNYTDKHIGKFLSTLDEKGILDNTVVVIYGDHGGMHKFYPNEIAGVKPSEKWWMENNYRVPFIIYSKGLKGEIIDTIGGQVDILPTIAYLMGVEEKDYIDTAMGRNLFKTEKSFAVLPNRKYVGRIDSEDEKNDAIKGIDIADLIIGSNYFKKQK